LRDMHADKSGGSGDQYFHDDIPLEVAAF
jgi:hypothetical protein